MVKALDCNSKYRGSNPLCRSMEITMLEVKHDSDDLDGGWDNVADFIPHAKLIAFDGCHKIYLAMDDYEAAWFRESYSQIVEDVPEVMADTLSRWFDDSCGLRFINAVYHTIPNANDGYINLISQFAGYQDEDSYEDYE